MQQAVEVASMHQVGADEAGKSERALHRPVRDPGKAQQEEGDQHDGDLDAHGDFRTAKKTSDRRYR